MPVIFIGHTPATPLGEVWMAVSENGLVAVEFPATQAEFAAWLGEHHPAEIKFSPNEVRQAVTQLSEYVAGTRRAFTLPIDWSVLNDFQRRVLRLTSDIPYGETRTYQALAQALGNPRLARAVGRAEATNPMPVVIPCHRVVGSDHKLHGYGAGGGISTKAWLLQLEQRVPDKAERI